MPMLERNDNKYIMETLAVIGIFITLALNFRFQLKRINRESKSFKELLKKIENGNNLIKITPEMTKVLRDLGIIM